MQIVLCLSHGLQKPASAGLAVVPAGQPRAHLHIRAGCAVEIAAAGDEQPVALRRRAQQTLHLRRVRVVVAFQSPQALLGHAVDPLVQLHLADAQQPAAEETAPL